VLDIFLKRIITYNITTYAVAIGTANERFSMRRRCLKIITYCATRYRYHLSYRWKIGWCRERAF